MNVTIEIPEDRAARFRKEAAARGLTVDKWLLELGEQHAPPTTGAAARNLVEVCAMVRGLADDLDITRNPSTGRTVDFE
jgi:hypothetical protein